MTTFRRAAIASFLPLATSLLVPLAGCSSAEPTVSNSSADAITSTDGSPLEFKFEAEVVAATGTPVKNAAVAQLEYLTGLLTQSSQGNAQFRFVDVSNAKESVLEGEKSRWTYTATLTVVYPAGKTVPSKLAIAFPKDVTALSEFNDAYDGKCGKNEYGRETFWHDFNPQASGCTLGDDVHQTEAAVRKHPLATNDTYPEYDQVWADDALKMVAVYGAISSSSDSDTGAREREQFLTKVKDGISDGTRTDESEKRDGIIRESKVVGTIEIDGKKRDVRLVAYFIDEAKRAGSVFEERFGAETEDADFILYSGHSGLGKNIKAIADATKVKAGKYQIAFFNGCQTLGYLGPKMHEDRITSNGADKDPNGTKFLDVIVTTLVARSESTPTEQLMFDAFVAKKKSYSELLQDFSGKQFISHITTVFGDDDNTFKP